jgi:hypothetical protein
MRKRYELRLYNQLLECYIEIKTLGMKMDDFQVNTTREPTCYRKVIST